MIRKVLSPQASLYLLRNSRSFSSSVRSRVKNIGSDEAYSQIATEGTERKAIVYFTAKWCPPCKMIGPIFDELSTQYEDIDFAKVDVDDLNETTSKAGVRVSSIRLPFDRCLHFFTSRMASFYSPFRRRTSAQQRETSESPIDIANQLLNKH